MFRRVAGLLEFSPRDGELVEIRGRLGVYEARGDLQLVVESMQRAGQGGLYEQFLRLKAKLEAEGLFEAARKRGLPPMPRGIGVVTSLGAAALHDVVTALQRRVPHIPVIVAPASVQGAGAPEELVSALRQLYRLAEQGQVDVVLLVRGGGSLEDLWAFNDERLARAVAQSPVPLVCGVGHETDFTIADFVADLRAPTPTAAAELAAQPRTVWLGAMERVKERLSASVTRHLDTMAQRLDLTANRLGRPSAHVTRRHLALVGKMGRLRQGVTRALQRKAHALQGLQTLVPQRMQRSLQQQRQLLERAGLRLELLDPSVVLRRGYAWLSDAQGRTISSVAQTHPGQPLQAILADGKVDLTVTPRAEN